MTEVEELSRKFIDEGDGNHVADDGNEEGEWFWDA